ncbi:MAG: hypothetical protein ABJK39_14680 [Hyphomicrobiales bacterium]
MTEYRVTKTVFTSLLSIIAASVLAACTTTGSSGPKPTVKQAVETAPADLQLACSSEVATRFPNSGNVLPLSSNLLGADVFRVRITSQAGSYVCDINRGGVIVSLLPAAQSTDQLAVDEKAIEKATDGPVKPKEVKFF